MKKRSVPKGFRKRKGYVKTKNGLRKRNVYIKG